MIVQQTQTGNVFQLPVAVDVWNSNSPKRYNIWVKNAADTFYFPSSSQPQLVNFDAERVLLGTKKENKSLEEFLFQYRNGKNYLARKEAIDSAFAHVDDASALQILELAVRDPYAGLRSYSIARLDVSNEKIKPRFENILFDIAQNEKHRLAKAAAIGKLGNYQNKKYAPLFLAAASDSSYSVAGNALEALLKIDTASAMKEIRRMANQPAKGKLANVIKTAMSATDKSVSDKMIKDFEAMPFGQEKFGSLQNIFEFMVSTPDLGQFKKAVDAIINFQDQVPAQYKEQIVPALNEALKEIQGVKLENNQKEFADYIGTKLKKA